MKRKMKPEVKAKWLEALRSGEYKQGRMKLKNEYNGSYCCLGVLCDVYHGATCDGFWNANSNQSGENFVVGAHASALYAPDAVLDWAGLDRTDSKYLATTNDDTFNFDTVIDLIERDL